MQHYKPLISRIITLCLGLSLVVISSEIFVRMAGHHPWEYVTLDLHEPTMHEPDSLLGWRNEEGNYVVPAYSPRSDDIQITFLADGVRTTGPERAGGREKLVIVGGSYTQGWAISDNETYPWKLQSNFPSVKVLNYGTGGYGTYQSLLVLERIFADPHHSIRMVLYGFVEHHEVRNVAPSGWLRILSKYSRRAHVYVPYCTIGLNGALIRHAPERYPAWPLRESLATINFLQDRYIWLKTKGRDPQKRVVTEKLLLEMNDLSTENDAIFAVVFLRASRDTRVHYAQFLRNNDIGFIDCVYPITPEMQVPGEVHPNGTVNTLWAHCIGKAIARPIAQVGLQ